MKKIVIILIGILVGLFVTLSLLTPKSEYTAEKRLWRILKEFNTIQTNPPVRPGELEDLVERTESFMREFPDSLIIPNARILLADINILNKEYSTAREKYADIMREYPNRPDIIQQTVTKIIDSYYKEAGRGGAPTDEKNIAETFEVFFDKPDKNEGVQPVDLLNSPSEEKDFQIILNAYKRIMRDYPTTVLGIQAPFLIAKLYHDENKVAQSQSALSDAIQYYQGFITQHKKERIGLQAYELLVSCHLIQGNLPKALRALGEILLEFADTSHLSYGKVLQITRLMNTLSQQANEVDSSITIYQNLIARYPEKDFVEIFDERMQELQKFKNNVAR